MSARLTFYRSCVGWDPDDVHEPGGLCDMIDAATQITRRTFLRHVDREEEADIERRLGYAPHDREAILRISKDWAVSYHRSRLHGNRVYFFTHSAIEFVFA